MSFYTELQKATHQARLIKNKSVEKVDANNKKQADELKPLPEYQNVYHLTEQIIKTQSLKRAILGYACSYFELVSLKETINDQYLKIYQVPLMMLDLADVRDIVNNVVDQLGLNLIYFADSDTQDQAMSCHDPLKFMLIW